MTTVRVVQGTRVLAEIRVEALADDTTVEVGSGAPAGLPSASSPTPRRTRAWPAGLAWTAFGIVGLLAGSLLEAPFWSPWNHSRWTDLAYRTFGGLLAFVLGAGLLFLVLKVIGRRIRFVDALRALALLAWIPPALIAASLVTYYPLSPQAHSGFEGLLAATVLSLAVAGLASLRREPRSLAFSAAWAGASFAALCGLAVVASLRSAETGAPRVDLDLQAPIAGYAGRAETLDDYLAAIRSAAEGGSGDEDRHATTVADPKAAALR